ncbi:MAG: single-stranded-DNA-specific exonuclease RecJ [Anaerolineales bacterium]|nr:single-stranded-DNA-specific exonuclease RecJ [Anaerolineales bacterium]
MPPLSKRWQIAPRLTPAAEQALSRYPAFLRQILFNRGYAAEEAAQRFLTAQPLRGSEPENLLGIPLAVERLQHAIRAGELVAVYGDYDADGVSATALLGQALAGLGAQVSEYIPNRFDEGYGLNKEALDTLSQRGAKVVITVDCGIRAWEEAEHARKLGIDLIITDHHHPLGELPHALAVINPKQAGDNYPDKDLAGVGIAYKLAAALFRASSPAGMEFRPGGLDQSGADAFLDLVALGTIADLAPLVGENRTLVRAGLKQLHRPHRQGIASLLAVSGLAGRRVTASDVGFVLGPRLNAAGRLESALSALQLLMTQDVREAGRLAQQLEIQNRERQELTRQTYAVAEQLALVPGDQPLLLYAAHEEFNPGIVGLVASRLCEQYYRPAIVAHIGQEFTRASCRSIPEFHITDALDRCTELMEHHGGHAAAAGFTVHNSRAAELIHKVEALATEDLAAVDLRPVISVDIELPLAELKPEFLEHLDLLQPTGYGNRQVIFVTRELKPQRYKAVGADGSHLKLSVTDGWITYDAIAFRQGHWAERLPPRIDLAYTFERNEFNGEVSLQLRVLDIKPSGQEN